uniref:Uncharacterized protein n=1 Tax=Oryza glumipatula TaxID=40148 RepID=A0A0E0ADT8_9ORYZ
MGRRRRPSVARTQPSAQGPPPHHAPPNPWTRVSVGAKRRRIHAGREEVAGSTPPIAVDGGSAREEGGEMTGSVREGKRSPDPPLLSPPTADPRERETKRRRDPGVGAQSVPVGSCMSSRAHKRVLKKKKKKKQL